jgi:plastocyanin
MNKSIFFLSGILLISFPLFSQQTHTITSEGLTYVPTPLIVSVGDIVQFSVGAEHPTVQVSQSTWNANQSTPLSGGFSFPSGSGSFSPDIAGTLYYVCTSHIGSGMKGTIIVLLPTAIDDNDLNKGKLYPVPAGDYLIYEAKSTKPVDEIKIMDLTGKPVILLENPVQSAEKLRIDVSKLNKGLYIIRIISGENISVKKFLKS